MLLGIPTVSCPLKDQSFSTYLHANCRLDWLQNWQMHYGRPLFSYSIEFTSFSTPWLSWRNILSFTCKFVVILSSNLGDVFIKGFPCYGIFLVMLHCIHSLSLIWLFEQFVLIDRQIADEVEFLFVLTYYHGFLWSNTCQQHSLNWLVFLSGSTESYHHNHHVVRLSKFHVFTSMPLVWLTFFLCSLWTG